MPDKQDIIDAMFRDAAGWDTKRKIAEDELEAGPINEMRRVYLEEQVKEAKEGKKNALAELEFYGFKAKAPAKRAETRPAETAEKRRPGRPKKVTS